MLWFIIALFVLAIGAFWFGINPTEHVDDKSKPIRNSYSAKTTYEKKEVSTRPLAVIVLFIGLVFLGLSMLTTVGTRNVGVVTSFNKPTGRVLDAGLHVKLPWQAVTDIDGSIQPEEYRGEECIKVKIADGGNACVTVAYRWRITENGADNAFMDYRNSDKDINDAVRDAVVSTNMKAAINEVFGQYDPLDGSELRPNMTPEELANAKVNVVPDYQAFNQKINENVEAKIADLGGVVEVSTVTVSGLDLPESTQLRINAFNQAVQNTKIALQDVATKAAQAEGNRQLAKSLRDPNVLVSKCIDGLISGEIENEPGFSCWQGGGGVVIPGTK